MKHLKKALLILLILCLVFVWVIFFIRNKNITKHNLKNFNDNPIEEANNISKDNNTKDENNESSKDNNTNNDTQDSETLLDEDITNIEEKTWKNITWNIEIKQTETQTIQPKEILIEYESKKNNFKIGIPDERAFQESTNWFNLKIKTINENLGVTIQELQTIETIESFTKKTIEWLKSLYKDYKEVEKENVEINWIKWISIIYEFSDSWHDIKAKQIALLKNNKSYIFQYTAEKNTFDLYIEKINKIIHSFTLLN